MSIHLLTLATLLSVLVAPVPQEQQLDANYKLRTNLRDGVSMKVWRKLDVVAVVRVGSHRRVEPQGSFATDFWGLVVLSKPDANESPTEFVQPGVGLFEPALEVGADYMVLGTLPHDGKDVDLFEMNATKHDRLPGQARVYWALPFRGTPPRSGGTKEEFFGRAILAALEGDPQVYKQGLEEFLLSTFLGFDGTYALNGGGFVGLPQTGGARDFYRWAPGEFTDGLIAWAARQGPRERLFAGQVMEKFGVLGARAYLSRSVLEFAATDADPPPRYSSSFSLGEAAAMTEAEGRLALVAPPTPEEWLTTLTSLRNPRAQEMLLECRLGSELGPEELRRLAVLLDNPLPRVRWKVCEFLWGRIIATSVPEEEAERLRPIEISEERRRQHGPPDYPRLDEHVAFWKAYYR